MTIDEIIKASKPYSGRKRENMTVLQRLRIDLVSQAQDYDHRLMHAYRNQDKEHQRIADDLVEIAQNYAWRYAKHKMIDLLDKLIDQSSDNRILEKATIIALMESHKEAMVMDLSEYQEQLKNMKLM